MAEIEAIATTVAEESHEIEVLKRFGAKQIPK
jgi:hypothetical protein